MKRLNNQDKQKNAVPHTRIAVFAGSFDPVTIGHEDLILRAVPLFDKIIVAIGENRNKKTMFPLDKRLLWLKQTFKDNPAIEVDTYDCLTVDYCKSKGASYLLRGVRNSIDFEYEKNIAQINMNLQPDIQTIFLLPNEKTSFVSSSFVRELHSFGKDISKFLPSNVQIN